MRALLIGFIIFSLYSIKAQIPLYEFRDIKKTQNVPDILISERSLVVVHVPDEVDLFRRVGEWEKLAEQAHKAFATIGIDAVAYINHYDLVASKESEMIYSEFFSKRKIKNIIFLTQGSDFYELVILPFNEKPTLIDNNIEAFYMKEAALNDVLLKTGKAVRRTEYEAGNFLILEKPSYLEGISIIEKSQLQNYPGILNRTKLVVEKFAQVTIPGNATNDTQIKIKEYNQWVDSKNIELEELLQSYPYEYELIEPMSNDDLVRSRHQFVLRCISGQAKTLRKMLDYAGDPGEVNFTSTIPIMPDQTRAKTIAKDALVHKFYIRQNISKNVHVGVWDADVSWQEALTNMIGNLIQEHKVDVR